MYSPAAFFTMDYRQRSLLVARLNAGVTPVRPGGVVYWLEDPSPSVRLLAEEALADVSSLCEEETLSEAEAEQLAGWGEADAYALKVASDGLDDARVDLFENWHDKAARLDARVDISRLRREIAALVDKRDRHKALTADAVAGQQKARLIAGFTLRKPNGPRALCDDPSVWPADLIEEVVTLAAAIRPGEAALREVARTAPWQGYWGVGGPNPFGVPASHLGDDRLALLNFSQLYDRVRESPERPVQEVIDDDDALDGWLIAQRRKAAGGDAETVKRDMIGSDRVGQCQNVFVITGGDNGKAETVAGWNSLLARRDIAQRMKTIEERRHVHHADLPDVRKEVMMQAAQLESEKMARR